MTFRPRTYWFAVFLLPLLLLSIFTETMVGLWAVLPAVVIGSLVIWLFQYFFLQ